MSPLARSLALGAAAALLPLPAIAHAGVVRPGVGIAGVSLGDTPAQVRSALGAPASVLRPAGGGTSGEAPPKLTYRYRTREVAFFSGGRVTLVETRDPADTVGRTGVGVGSTEAAIRLAMPGLRCEAVSGTLRFCRKGGETAGARVTDVRIRNGRVSTIGVGVIID